MNKLFDYLRTQRISVISLAGKIDINALNDSIKFFKENSINVNIMPHTYDENYQGHYFASSIENRLNDLYQAWNNSDIIICSRGGYGSIEVANSVDWDRLKNSNNNVKLIGYSDISAFHMAMLNHNVGTPISGMMFLKFPIFSQDELNAKSLYNALQNSCINEDLKHLNLTKINNLDFQPSQIVVANLTMLCSLCGTKFFPNLKDKTLLIEDINEPIYKIERMLNQLYLNNVFTQINGLIFGDFTNCGTQEEFNQVIKKFTQYGNFPVAINFPFGHGDKVFAIDMTKTYNI